MPDNNPQTSPLGAGRASPLFLREEEVRHGIELMFFGHASLLNEADSILHGEGLGRAHHRALYFVARSPGLPVSRLLQILGITKQSLSRVLSDLVRMELVEQRTGEADRRQRLIFLTGSGRALEARLFEAMRSSMAGAYQLAGQHAVTGFWSVLAGLIPPEERALVASLSGTG